MSIPILTALEGFEWILHNHPDDIALQRFRRLLVCAPRRDIAEAELANSVLNLLGERLTK